MLRNIYHISGASLCEEAVTHESSRPVGDLSNYCDKFVSEMARNLVMLLENMTTVKWCLTERKMYDLENKKQEAIT